MPGTLPAIPPALNYPPGDVMHTAAEAVLPGAGNAEITLLSLMVPALETAGTNKENYSFDTLAKADRQALKQALLRWRNALVETDSVTGVVEYCSNHIATLEGLLQHNLLTIIKEIKPVETAYRALEMFFINAGEDEVKKVSFLNASSGQLHNTSNTVFADAIKDELVNCYDRLDMRNNYSLLVLPGYIQSATALKKWAKTAYENKVMLVTDFADLGAADDVMELFDAAGLTSDDPVYSNVMMTCNWLTARGKYGSIGEDDHLYVPPSVALAGKIYNTLMSQVTAGKKFGWIAGTESVRFPLKKTETAFLEKLGLVPLVKDCGRVMALSAKTLFNGPNTGLQTYSVVRVFDYVTKVMMHFLNGRAFENFNAASRKNLHGEIVQFLDTITGTSKLIENFYIKRFEQDPVKKDRIYLDLHLKPYFPAKNFLIRLEGNKEETQDRANWAMSYED